MKKLSVLALFLMLFSFQAEAQVKIGYTNPEVILSQLPEVQSINQEIGDLLERKDSLLAIQALALQKELEDYSAAKDVMTLEQRQQKEQDLIEKNKDFEEERQKSLNEVQQRQITLLQPIENKVYAAIKTVADSLGLDLVLNEGSMNSAFIFYASDEQMNITELVLEKLKQS
ncbi:MAG: OmpH family outer membrane protein [Balneola sp.]|jgi:outer membrane protein